MRGEAYRWFVRGVGLALGVGLVFAILTTIAAAAKVAVLAFVAILLGSALEPVIGWARSHTRLGRASTIIVVYLGFFAAVLGLVLLVVPVALLQLAELGTRLPAFLLQARESASTLQPPALADSVTSLIESARQALQPSETGPDAGFVIEAGIHVLDAAISLATVLALVFFWLTEHARLQRYALAFLPPARRAGARETWNEMEVRLGSWVRGQLILMAAMGAMTTVAYFVLGLREALVLGLIAGIAEAIPIVGPLIGAVPALIVAAATGRMELVLLVAAVYVVIQVVEGNVLVPIVMRNTIGISPFLVIVAILTGAAVAGIVGALLAVPIAAAIEVMLERMQAREQPVPLDPAGAAGTAPDRAAREAAREALPDSRATTTP